MKVMISLMIYFIFASFCISCNREGYYPSREEELVNSILGETAKIIKAKYQLIPCGSGASMPEGPIRKLALCFTTKYPFTKEELRVLLIKAANELVQQVNENEEIQGFLKEPPFTIKNVQIIIYNHDERGRAVYDPQILTAQICHNILTYRTVESEEAFTFKQEFIETYEEALKIIQN